MRQNPPHSPSKSIMDAPVLYIVRFWVDPEGSAQVLAWLDGGHCAEVVAQPGFRFVQRIGLKQKNEDGWAGYFMLYGLDSHEALESYFDNTALAEKFAQQRAPFAKYLRMDRAWDSVESTLTR